jgi:membrane associated rhomboid family serine protease
MNPTRRTAWVTILVIAANAAVFGYQAFVLSQPEGRDFVLSAGLIPRDVVSGFRPSTAATFFTSMFLHGGFLHLIGNMLFLWIFGNNIEDALGPLRFLLFYTLSGAAAAGAHIGVHSASTVPVIGASGAIAGILGAYARLYPRAKVKVLWFWIIFVRVLRVPAFVVLPLWFLLQVFNGVGSLHVTQGEGVAWFAHIGGFLFGLLTIGLFGPRRRRPVPEEPAPEA